MAVVSLSIQRIHDREYQVEMPNQHVFRFKIADKKIDAETSIYLVQKALKVIVEPTNPDYVENFLTKRFRYGDKKWKVIRPNTLSWIEKILLILFPFYRFRPSKDQVTQFEIKSATLGPSLFHSSTKATRVSKKQWKQTTGSTLPRSNYKHFKASLEEGIENSKFRAPINQEDYIQGVRGSVFLESWQEEDYQKYNDPFTQLSSLAFQLGESNFSGRDNVDPDACNYCMIKNGPHLQLVHQTSSLATQENKTLAKTAYIDFLIAFYGEEKIHYIDHLYLTDIYHAEVLTPEHVYRFNIGTTNIEDHDVKLLCDSLITLTQMSADVKSKTKFQDFARDHLPLSQVYALNEHLSAGKENSCATVRNFKSWMKQMSPLIEEGEIRPEVFNELMHVIYPSLNDKENAYTGRKITQVIQSAYTLAGLKQYKPWIDQQEVTQISEDLLNCSSWESYHECLAHILAKKHLARTHPTDGIRLGALIPLPAFHEGSSRWYKVSSFITNQYTYSYTLESASYDPSIPPIKLYRSTASSEYAVYATKSIANDFSQLNSPGYLGASMLHKYEKDFFDKRTIPVWVGYQYAADCALQENDPDIERIQELLSKANRALLEEERTKEKPKTLSEIIRENDAILNDLFMRYSKVLGYKHGDRNKDYLSIHRKLIRDYIRNDDEIVDLAKQKDDALLLKHILVDLLKDSSILSPRDADLIQTVVDQVKAHILSKNPNRTGKLAFQTYYDTIHTQAMLFEENACNRLAITEVLDEWAFFLRTLAESRGENKDSKMDQEIHLSGHSLGGACLSVGFMENIIKRNRIPVRHCRLFEFDAPGINNKDNEAFKSFGNEHAALMKQLKVGFSIVRRQEAGDILPRGGDVHLGATFTDAETSLIQEWLRFDAAVNERLGTSRKHEIAESASFHSTRFGEGEPLRTFHVSKNVQAPTDPALDPIALEREILAIPILKKKINDRRLEADYLRTYYTPKVQGLFDSHGKKGDVALKNAYRDYQYLFYKVWKMPALLENLSSEGHRKKEGTGWMLMRQYLFQNRVDAHQIKAEHLDIHGCCAVSVNDGILSALKTTPESM